MTKNILVFLSICLLFGLSSSDAHASSESNRYLVRSSSSFARHALGTVHHDFGKSFTIDLNSFQLRIAKMLKLDFEKVDALHISSLVGDEQAPETAVLEKTFRVAILDTSTAHGKSLVDIVGGEARLYEVCTSRGICYADDVAEGIRSAVDDGAKIINMSFGTDHANDLINDAIAYAVSHNVVLVAAAGNNGPFEDSVEYPASHESVIAVGALESDGTIASWSSRGDVDVWELGEYENVAGTSISSARYSARRAHLLEQ